MCGSSNSVAQRLRGSRVVPRRAGAGGGGFDAEPVSLALSQRLQELATLAEGEGGLGRWETLGGCEVLAPRDQFPWGVVFFLGGAVLGQYPRVCYDALLRPLADRGGCCIVAVPYAVDVDHGALAEVAEARFQEAVALLGERYGWDVARMPTFALGHSLGAKLHVLRHCGGAGAGASARGADAGGGPAGDAAARGASGEAVPVDGTAAAAGGAAAEPLALLAFNNFGIADSLALAKEALDAFRGSGVGGGGPPGMDALWKALEPMARQAATRAGLEFRPGPEEMEQLMRSSFSAPTTKVLKFDLDRLDCAEQLIDATADRPSPVQRVVLRGGHLTPVVIKVSDLAGAAAQGPLGSRLGAEAQRRGLEFGDAADLEDAVEALLAWLRPS